MTMGEFARKWGLPYQDVQRASFRSAGRLAYPGQAYGTDFDEADLKRAVTEELQKQLDYHRILADRAAERLARLNGKAAGT